MEINIIKQKEVEIIILGVLLDIQDAINKEDEQKVDIKIIFIN